MIGNEEMNVLLLHHAGGDKYAFRPLQESLGATVQCIALEAPGRGDRYGEPLQYSLNGLLDDFTEQIKQHIYTDYVIVGMSMGAVLTFLITHRLKLQHQRLPQHIFLASRLPFSHYETNQVIAQSSSDAFWEFLSVYDSRSAIVAEHPELRAFYEPIIRADFTAMQHFDQAFDNLPKLDTPCSILYGKEDVRMFDAELGKRWNEYFVRAPEYKAFDGGHFFLYENAAVADYILETIRHGRG